MAMAMAIQVRGALATRPASEDSAGLGPGSRGHSVGPWNGAAPGGMANLSSI
jgi:hypothetical protein